MRLNSGFSTTNAMVIGGKRAKFGSARSPSSSANASGHCNIPHSELSDRTQRGDSTGTGETTVEQHELKDFKTLHNVFKLCDLMLLTRDEMPVSLMKTYLGVILWGADRRRDDPLTMLELADKIGLPATTVSRHLRYLGEYERPGVSGADLVQTSINPLDRRQRIVELTSKGRALRDNVMHMLAA